MNFFERKRKKDPTKERIIARVRLEFCMMIEDMFVIREVGTIVTGVVEAGMCNVGEPAVIIHNGKEIETEIISITLMGEQPGPVEIARPNERVGLGLKGIAKEQLEQGEVQIGDWVIVRNGQADIIM